MHTVVTIIEVIRLGDHLSICYAVLSLERMSMALIRTCPLWGTRDRYV